MKSLSASNRHLQSASARQQGVERNVRSSSAIEGVSATVFRTAAVSGQYVTRPKGNSPRTVVINDPRPKKK